MTKIKRRKGVAKNYITAKICPYCKSKPVYNKKIKKYVCPKCQAKVNVDAKGKPLGSVADKGMAYKRWYAHSMIEPLGKQVGRSNVYRYLTRVMGRKTGTVHTAKMSEVQLDILINILKKTTVKKIKERLGLNMDNEKLIKSTVEEVVDEVYKEKIVPEMELLNARLKLIEFDRALTKFEKRLRDLGLPKKWEVMFRQEGDYEILYLESKSKCIDITKVPGKTMYVLIPVMNQCKVPFQMWLGQEKPTLKQWIKDQK